MTASVHSLFPTEPAPLSAEDEFDVWYRAYPKKEARGYAVKAFKIARRKASLEQLVNGLARYVESVSGKDRQYIALPASWLNGERWLDEAETLSTADPNYARLRAFQTRGVWLPQWGKKPEQK